MWLTRFIRHLKDESTSAYIRYDYNAQLGELATAHLSSAEVLRGYLECHLIQATVKWLREAGFKDHPLYSLTPAEFLTNPTLFTDKVQSIAQEALAHLNASYRRRLIVIIDNLDLCDLTLQKTAVDHANYLARWAGVYPLVSLRPATYHKLHLYLRRPVLYQVTRPPIREVLEKRLTSVWPDEKGNEYVRKILRQLQKVKVQIEGGVVVSEDPRTVRRLHELVIGKLGASTRYLTLLHDMHNSHTRNVLTVLAQILRTFFLSDELLKASGSHVLPHHALVTAYLRGPFVHYRGYSHNYWVKDLRIFEIPRVPSEYMLISIRICQLVNRGDLKTGGMEVEELATELVRFGYPHPVVIRATEHLARLEILNDVYRQKEWGAGGAQPILEADDCFALSSCGTVILGKLLGEYAFRFCDALADVTSRARLDGQSWQSDKSFRSMIWNALGMVELFQAGAAAEIGRLKGASAGTGAFESLRDEFRAAFMDETVPGGKFIEIMTEECCSHSTRLNQVVGTQTNLGFDNVFGGYITRIMPFLIGRAHQLQKLEIPE